MQLRNVVYLFPWERGRSAGAALAETARGKAPADAGSCKEPSFGGGRAAPPAKRGFSPPGPALQSSILTSIFYRDFCPYVSNPVAAPLGGWVVVSVAQRHGRRRNFIAIW